MTGPILNLQLARRIELAEARAAVGCARAIERERPETRAAVEPIAGGFAVYCGANSPATQAVGLGLSGSINEEEFTRLEQFYRSRSEPVRVETCPLADASLIHHFAKNGYRVTEFSNVMACPLTASEGSDRGLDLPSGITIEKLAKEQMDLWTVTVAQRFSEHYPVTQELLDVMKMFSIGSNVECYIARVDGAVAGGATLSIRDGVAGLFGASTLLPFRNRGVQTALLKVRLVRAVEAGCDLAACLAQPGSASQRNALRQGFSTLYTRVKFERAWS